MLPEHPRPLGRVLKAPGGPVQLRRRAPTVEALCDRGLHDLGRELLDPLDARGEVVLVRVQLLSELTEELQRWNAIPGLEPGDVRSGTPRKGELALGKTRFDASLLESSPDRRRVVDVRMVVRCSHREPQSRVKTAASSTHRRRTARH